MKQFWVILAGIALSAACAKNPIILAPIDITLQGQITEVAPYSLQQLTPEDIIVSWAQRSLQIPYDQETTRVSFTITARKTGALELQVDGIRAMLSERLPNPYTVIAGETISISMVMFEPHAGELLLRNTTGDVIAVLPYEVSKQSPFRNRINASVNTSGDLTGGYSITHAPSNLGFGVNIQYRPESDSFSGSANGHYSW